MPTHVIRHRITDAILYTLDAATLADAMTALCREASDANLSDADLSDADLSDADLSDADLRCANLRCANLTGAYLSSAYIVDAYLVGADLSGANLTGADLSDADLRGASLRGANLSGANLRGATGLDTILTGVPVVANLHQRIEEATRDTSALDMGAWHTCATTHCRAGWAITLAGEAGRKLEETHGPATAGALIYLASGARRVPNFYDSNEDARADIVACAEAERAAAASKQA